MRSTATTVEGYLAEQTPEQRQTLEAIRAVIRANIDPEFHEVMQYGMIGYVVPHERYPPGFHCNPRDPLPFAGLGAQKSAISLHAMFLYAGAEELRAWFTSAYAATGKKLDMGKACIRWKKPSDVPLELIGALFAKVSCASYIATYEAQLATRAGKDGATARRRSARSPRR